jgi:hypothetical protein
MYVMLKEMERENEEAEIECVSAANNRTTKEECTVGHALVSAWGSHSSTFRLNLSAFCGIRGTF